ncbi:MAG: YbaN family protein [Pseudomonadales bacterium]|nr:YbaN family protein [Pseudomonadales bacterium]
MGILSLLLGAIGIFLPLLPTTPFILLALLCFSRSSPRLYQWLKEHPCFALLIANWQDHRCISLVHKRRAYTFIVIGFSISIYTLAVFWLQLMLSIMMLGLLFFIYSTASEPRAEIPDK